jgi:hypothetical protein
MPDNPSRFFTHDRLDLVVKYRFFDMLLRGRALSDVQEMYTRHILSRTGGVEPGSSRKTSLALYVTAARVLFDRMREIGFDPSAPIPVDQWGRLRDGAHRVACAAVLGLKVEILYLKVQYPIRQWGIDWFLAHGFSRKYVNGLLDHLNVITGYSAGAVDAAEVKPRKRTILES